MQHNVHAAVHELKSDMAQCSRPLQHAALLSVNCAVKNKVDQLKLWVTELYERLTLSDKDVVA
jgi:hypothetical protein